MLDLDALEAKALAYAQATAAAKAIAKRVCATEQQADEFWRARCEFYNCLGEVDGVLALIERVRVAGAEAAVSEQALLLLVTTWCGKVGMCDCCHVVADCPEAEDPHVLEGPSAVAGSEHLRAWAIRAARRSLGLPEVGACG